MRRTPPGQIQKLYKRLYDLYERYPKRWVDEKGYGDADYFKSRMKNLLRDMQAALEGRPIPGTAPERRESPYATAVQRHIASQQRPYPGHQWGGFDRSPEFEPEFEPQDYTQGRPLPRQITMSPGRSRFVPRKSKSRSIRPSFLRKSKKR